MFSLSLSLSLDMYINISEIPPHSLEWLPSRTQTTTNVGEDAGRKEPHTLLVGM
jgi:hypothetical protein